MNQGVLACARYAFAPNFYHYCGPDTEGEFGDYLRAETADRGLVEHLNRFEVLYPYLMAIAQANGISDPLDSRVVEAYWVGNELLEKVTPQETFEALTEKQKLPRRIPKNELKWLLPKIGQRALLHHSFHVFNVFTRTGHHTVQHTVESMDQCRIGWGKVIDVNKLQGTRNKLPVLDLKTTDLNHETKIGAKASLGEKIDEGQMPQEHEKTRGLVPGKLWVESQQLMYQDGQLKVEPKVREVVVPAEEMGKRIKPGDWVSFHWGFVCERLSEAQVKRLAALTKHHLALANVTL